MKKHLSFAVCLCLLLSAMLLPYPAVAQEESEVVDVSFREMEKPGDLNSSGVNRAIVSTHFTQGGASLACTAQASASTGNMMVYIYRIGQGSNPVNITGATHLAMDLWVPTDGYFDKVQGDAGVNIDDADNVSKWSGTGGRAMAADVKNALKGMKAGWNFVTIPLSQASTCTNAADFRFYVINSGIEEGSTFYIDDVRFMNQAAIQSIMPERNAAKQVAITLSQGKIGEATAIYGKLLHRQREYISAEFLNQFGIDPIPATEKFTLTFDTAGGRLLLRHNKFTRKILL